jgi:hypothetical protein
MCGGARLLHLQRAAIAMCEGHGFLRWFLLCQIPLPNSDFYGKLLAMGSKDKGRKEVKKAPKPKPKPEPGRKREVFTPAPPK